MYDGILAETITIQGHDGDDIPAYLARPLGPGPYPGVVVIHHMPGYDPPTKEIARTFATHGYVAICPNLHYRYAPDADPLTAAGATREAGGVPDAQCIGDVAGAMKYLRSLPYSSGKVGVIGYCSGGRQSYIVACNLPFDAAVDCYGGRVVATPDELTERQPVSPIDMTPNLLVPAARALRRRRPQPVARDGGADRRGAEGERQGLRVPHLRRCGPRVLHRRPPQLQRRRRRSTAGRRSGTSSASTSRNPTHEPASADAYRRVC